MPRPAFSFHLLLTMVLTLLVGGIMAMEGFPFIVHWDEEVVFERPFKRFYQYLLGDITTTSTLYDWLLLFWYGFGFLVGKLLGLWDEFEAFKEFIIIQDGRILVWGRILSALFVTAGNGVLVHLFSKISTRFYPLLLASLCIVFNPIALPSLFLMKLDALVYLYTCIMLNLCYRYMVIQEEGLRQWLYIMGFFTLAIRVELLLFPCILLLYDSVHSQVITRPSTLRFVAKFGGIGTILAFLVTLYPISYIYTHFWNQGEGLEPKISYGGNIIERIIGNLSHADFVNKWVNTLLYYLDLLGWELGFLIFAIVIYALIQNGRKRYLGLYLLAFLGILILFGMEYVHYAVSLSIFLLSLGILYLLEKNTPKYILLLAFQAIWLLSISLPYLIFIHQSESPVIRTREYALKHTPEKGILAIESLSGSAIHPHIEECRLTEKIQTAKAVSKFGGTQLQILLEKGYQGPCRPILDICDVNYLSSEPNLSNEFVNTYDIPHFEQQAPSWYIRAEGSFFISNHEARIDSFYDYINLHYSLDTTFHKNEGIFDPRLEKINIRQTFYVFKRKDF